jgi:hypothetical protein
LEFLRQGSCQDDKLAENEQLSSAIPEDSCQKLVIFRKLVILARLLPRNPTWHFIIILNFLIRTIPGIVKLMDQINYLMSTGELDNKQSC